MRVVVFCHSLLSEWNHGNAHFLRGIATELQSLGHEVRIFEPIDSWSYRNMVQDHGEASLETFAQFYPGLKSERYDRHTLDLDESLSGADLVLVHEWNEPELVSQIGRHRARNCGYLLLFHDTHHRSVTNPESVSRYRLNDYDGVLAFGNSVAGEYRKHGWGRRVWTWHEAADTRIFRPLAASAEKGDLVWIGNWGDEERSAELREFLIEPVRQLHLRVLVHGVRYPKPAIEELQRANIQYEGWLPNYEVPRVFANHHLTLHVPRKPYASALPGVPTIRMFEALACGMPLISAPWEDSEHLFHPGEDFLFARDGAEMKSHLQWLLCDHAAAAELGACGRRTILERHTCAHRVAELLTIVDSLGTPTHSPVYAGEPI